MPSDGFHNLHSEACVPGLSAGRSEHLQPDHHGEPDTQASSGGERRFSELFFFCGFLEIICVFVLPQAHLLVCRALSIMLLLPWPNLSESEQQWQTRSSNHASLLAALTREYRVLRGTVNITPRQPGLDDSQYLLYLYSCFSLCCPLCLHAFSSLPSESGHPADSAYPQRHCGQHLRRIHQITSDLLPESSGVCPSVAQPFPGVHPAPRSVHHPQSEHASSIKAEVIPPPLDVTDEMLAFFLTLFQALRVQMGVAFTGQIIHTFLSMFTR